MGDFFSFQIMTVFLSIPVLCELTAFTCMMNSTVTLHSQAFSPRTSWGMQLDCHLIMSVRKYSTLTSSEGASIQFTSMVLATLPLLKVSMCCLCKSSITSLCVYIHVCIHSCTHKHFHFSSCIVHTLIGILSRSYKLPKSLLNSFNKLTCLFSFCFLHLSSWLFLPPVKRISADMMINMCNLLVERNWCVHVPVSVCLVHLWGCSSIQWHLLENCRIVLGTWELYRICLHFCTVSLIVCYYYHLL